MVLKGHHKAERLAFRTVNATVKNTGLRERVHQLIYHAAAGDLVRHAARGVAQENNPRQILDGWMLNTRQVMDLAVRSGRQITLRDDNLVHSVSHTDLFENHEALHPRVAALREQFSSAQVRSASLTIVRLLGRQSRPTDEMVKRGVCISAGLDTKTTSTLIDGVRQGAFEGYVEEATAAQSLLVQIKFSPEDIITAAMIIRQGCEQHQPEADIHVYIAEILDVHADVATEILQGLKKGVVDSYGDEVKNARQCLEDEATRVQREEFQHHYSNDQVRIASEIMAAECAFRVKHMVNRIAAELELDEEEAQRLFSGILEGDIT